MYLGRIVETGPTERVFTEPRAPLYQGAARLDPLARPRAPKHQAVALGDVPSPDRPPPGCHYHPRCAVRLATCSRYDPPVMPLHDGFSRCVLTPDAEDSPPDRAEIAMATPSP